MKKDHSYVTALKFIGLTFILTFSMNGLMAFALHSKLEGAAISFAGVQMLYPALIAIWMLGGLSKNSGALQGKCHFFSKAFAFTTLLSMLLLIIGTLTKIELLMRSSLITATVISLPLFLFLIFDKKNSLDAFKLNLKKGFKPGLLAVAVYGLITLSSMIPFFIMEVLALSEPPAALQLKTLLLSLGTMTGSLVLNLLVGSSIFLGEELGWRYFLQPHLQNVFGKRGGVIALGIIWGLWHAPLNFMLYNPQTPLLGILSHVLFCIATSIFFAYVYLRTQNLWPCILIHLFNNSSAAQLNPSMESELTLATTLISGALLLLTFGPFLFSSTFKTNSIPIPSLHQNEDSRVAQTLIS